MNSQILSLHSSERESEATIIWGIYLSSKYLNIYIFQSQILQILTDFRVKKWIQYDFWSK
jgi:hypothetical protein